MEDFSMSTISVAINREPVFTWEATETEAMALLERYPSLTGKFDPEHFAQSSLVYMRDRGINPDGNLDQVSVKLGAEGLDAHVDRAACLVLAPDPRNRRRSRSRRCSRRRSPACRQHPCPA
jgi:hypothetical protein